MFTIYYTSHYSSIYPKFVFFKFKALSSILKVPNRMNIQYTLLNNKLHCIVQRMHCWVSGYPPLRPYFPLIITVVVPKTTISLWSFVFLRSWTTLVVLVHPLRSVTYITCSILKSLMIYGFGKLKKLLSVVHCRGIATHWLNSSRNKFSFPLYLSHRTMYFV